MKALQCMRRASQVKLVSNVLLRGPMILGAHESTAGGLSTAFGRGAIDGCHAIQVFTKNGSQWREPELTDSAIATFREAREAAGHPAVLAHASYLINLCAPSAEQLARSKDSLVAEVLRSSALGVDFVVLHPGAHMGAGEEDGLRRVVIALDEVLDRTRNASSRILIENTAGQGSTLGHRFEHVGKILGGVSDPARLGVCFDTQHAFASGYDARTAEGYARVWEEFDANVPPGSLAAFHLNDSKKPLGSHVDRHEHIGEGLLGKEFFWRLMNDPRFAAVPGVLETEPREGDAPFRDEVDLLRALRGAPEPVPEEKPFVLEVLEAPKSKRIRR
jgi:deoxyribonuclease IV